MIRYFPFLIILFMETSLNYSQTIASFEVEPQKETNGLNVLVSINLTNITFLPDTSLTLFELRDNKKIPVPFQIDESTQRTLNWIIKTGEKKKYLYELSQGTPDKTDEIKSVIKDGTITIHSGNKDLLCYNFKTVYPPEGVDTAYKRSGFIHPLWSPKGDILTRIQPPDHYHHYGIWNPWTHVLFEGDTVDFWNIGDKKGTVRFAKLLSVVNGPVYSVFKVLHEHVAFKKDGSEKVAINEIQSIKAYKPEDGKDYFFVDINIEMNCAGESPVLLLAYRYGGLGWRATEYWNKDNSEVLSSEGKTRKDADGSLARWCIVQGELEKNYGGVVMMSYPANYNHPEPLRIWPENQYDRGDMFANFSPTKNKDWLLEPGNKYHLKYRFMVFNNHLSKEEAESAWHYFSYQPEIKVQMSK